VAFASQHRAGARLVSRSVANRCPHYSNKIMRRSLPTRRKRRDLVLFDCEVIMAGNRASGKSSGDFDRHDDSGFRLRSKTRLSSISTSFVSLDRANESGPADLR
jgi:hypothetical protein